MYVGTGAQATVTSLLGVYSNGYAYTFGAAAVASFINGYYVPLRSQSNWNDSTSVIGNVVGLLAWKNYGNSHVIFDASNGTSPSGTGVSQTNPTNLWTASYPTLMGWNGVGTYGVRVDSARISDSTSGSAGSVDFNNITNKTGGTGTYQTSGDFRAPIFYDSNDTTYYADFNSTTSAIFRGSVGLNNTSPINTAWGNASTTTQLSMYGSGYSVINLRGDNGGTARTFSMGVGDNRFYMCYDNTAARHNLTIFSDGSAIFASSVTATGGFFTGLQDGVVNQENGTSNTWKGRILSKNSTSDKAAFLGTYASIAGVFAHNNALNAWADLYVNTVDGTTSGAYVRLPLTTLINGYAAVYNSGSWAISVTGSSGTSNSTIYVSSPDGGRNPNTNPLPNTTARALSYDFAGAGYITGATGNYAGVMTYAPWDGTSASSGDSSYQLAFCNWSGLNASGLPGLALRNGINSTWNATWYQMLHSGNYTSYAPSLTGSGASGNWSINVTGSSESVRHYASRTDGTYYNVVWAAGSPSPMYSCDAVQIQSSTGTLAATNLTATRSYAAMAPTVASGNWVASFQATPVSAMAWGGDVSSGGPLGTWWFQVNMRHSNPASYWGTQLAYGWEDNANEIYQRNVTGNNFSGWVRYLNSNNYNLFALPLTGGNLSGTLTFSQPVGLGFANGQYVKDNGSGGFIIYGAALIQLNSDVQTSNYMLVGGNYSNNAYNSVASTRLMFGGGNSDALQNYYIGTNLDYYGGNYTKLEFRWHTGIRMGAQPGYGGIRMYDTEDLNTVIFSVGETDSNTRGYYDIIAYASDKRLKHNIKPIENALSKVISLTGMTYQWNELGRQHGWEPDMEIREAGVFAQDVQAVLPEAVRPAPFDYELGKSKSGENFLTVKYEKIVPLLIEAIKEQQLQIEELKAKLNES